MLSASIMIFDAILDFFKNLGEFVIDKVPDGIQPSDLLLAIAVGGFLIYIIFSWIRTNKSYEVRLVKSLDSMNEYFYRNPTINSDNLKEFNNRMKAVPKAVREQWQTYMLFRDKEPSSYLTIENCIERPMRYTSYKTSLKNTSTIFNVFMIVLMSIVCGGILFNAGNNDLGAAMFNSLMVVAVVYFLKFILKVIMNVRYSAILSDIYSNFGIFQRGIDKAVVGLPDYIDYEMLFTKKEIRNNIPILQDYIERRERKEKEELEKARNSEVEHENFDFSAVGLNASLLLERALKECETYINNKKRLLYKIAQKNQELLDYKTNYENLNKEQLKQQQISKENLERLRQSAETSTNRVEAGRIAKQQEEELKRQEQLEKDASSAYDKYLKQKDIIEVEVKALEDELAQKKQYIEDVVMAEFKTYSSKIFDEAMEKSDAKYSNIINEMKEDNEILSDEVKSKILQLEQNGIDTKPTLKYEAKMAKDKAKEAEKQAQQEKANEERLERAMQTKINADSADDEASEVQKSVNEAGDFVEDLKIDDENQFDVGANAEAEINAGELEKEPAIDAEKLKKDLKSELTSEINQDKIKEDLKNQLSNELNKDKIKEDLKSELASELNKEQIKEDLKNDLRKQLKDEIKGEITDEIEEENAKKRIDDSKFDSYGGYYDMNGNYIYRDGSYYDVQGNYYDANGKLLVPANANSNLSGGSYSASGSQGAYNGYYDAQGNYIYEDGSYYDPQGNYFNNRGELVKPAEEVNGGHSSGDNGQDMGEQGSYDANGNYVYADGSYYDANGNYFDAQGNLVKENESGESAMDKIEDEHKAEAERIEGLKFNDDAEDDEGNNNKGNK